MVEKSGSFGDHLNDILVTGEIIAAVGGGMAGPIQDAKLPIVDPVEKQGIELMANIGDALEERYQPGASSDLEPVEDGLSIAISKDVDPDNEVIDIGDYFEEIDGSDLSGDDDSDEFGLF
ncbi:hypothetical protein OS123_03245 [Corynebacterium sp. P5875]|uniref:Uncharacterized protein n=1 Tax=Corynebacterium antarcticum TaxID=2800405 RepID=A0A9Q4GNA9_9CORY|nr:hypothetical protein [Corynebacterium antarcticum]MCX7537564.1 hypothetical protein [Corynebacterium antarcticum]